MIAEQGRREEHEEERKRGRIALDNDADIPRQQNCSRLITSEFALSEQPLCRGYRIGQNLHLLEILPYCSYYVSVLEWSGVLITAQAGTKRCPHCSLISDQPNRRRSIFS